MFKSLILVAIFFCFVGSIILLVVGRSAYENKTLSINTIDHKVPYEIGQGTGYFVNDNTIITDAHVAEEGSVLTAVNPNTGQTSILNVVLLDQEHDIAILQTTTKMDNITPICVSNEDVKAGQQILSSGFGNAYQEDFNMGYHYGHVSGFYVHQFDAPFKNINYVLTDLLSIPGDSGSPILALHGCVIGNVHFGPYVQGNLISNSTGVTEAHFLYKYLSENNISFSAHAFTFASDQERLKNSVVRIAISNLTTSILLDAVAEYNSELPQ